MRLHTTGHDRYGQLLLEQRFVPTVLLQLGHYLALVHLEEQLAYCGTAPPSWWYFGSWLLQGLLRLR
jgi:hypothetical protein